MIIEQDSAKVLEMVENCRNRLGAIEVEVRSLLRASSVYGVNGDRSAALGPGLLLSIIQPDGLESAQV